MLKEVAQQSTFPIHSSCLPPSISTAERLCSLSPISLLSLPCSHHSWSQAPSLAATISPPPPLWALASAAWVSPAVCSLAVTVQAEPNAAQPPIWAQGRGREALKTAGPVRKTRQHWLLSSSTGCRNLKVHPHLLICFFKAEIHKSFLPLFSSVVSLSVDLL